MVQNSKTFDGLRVLVVEDDFFVAKSLGALLRSLGCIVVGPASTAEDACTMIKAERVDAAVLDITLTPGTSAPVARALRYRACPFFFVTGYNSLSMLPDDLRGYRVLHKPVDCETLCSAIHDIMTMGDQPVQRPAGQQVTKDSAAVAVAATSELRRKAGRRDK